MGIPTVERFVKLALKNSDEDGPYGCCNVCQHRQTEECDQCNDADLFELDEETLQAA